MKFMELTDNFITLKIVHYLSEENWVVLPSLFKDIFRVLRTFAS